MGTTITKVVPPSKRETIGNVRVHRERSCGTKVRAPGPGFDEGTVLKGDRCGLDQRHRAEGNQGIAGQRRASLQGQPNPGCVRDDVAQTREKRVDFHSDIRQIVPNHMTIELVCITSLKVSVLGPPFKFGDGVVRCPDVDDRV